MAMSTSRTLFGPPSEYLNPPFRIVNFADAPAVVIVSTQLRHAWTALAPSESPTDETVFDFIKANHALTPEQRREQVPQNEDKDSIDTLWRVMVLRRWMSVFVDVSGFLQQVGPGIGHLKTHGVFGIKYPSSSSDEQLEANGSHDEAAVGNTATIKAWDTNVLLVPAYLERGVSLRATIIQSNEDGTSEEAELGTFSEANPTECWYVREGVEVHFSLEGDHEGESEGIAAVLAVGILCLEDHGEDNDGIEDEVENDVKPEEEVLTRE